MDHPDHILVVDDDAEIRRLLEAYLGANGYRVSGVRDGRGMWAAIEHARPDLVVLDLMLPGEDGLSLCRGLRARGDLPVIIVSARGEESERITGLELGADDYLPKPFAPRELLARIKGVLRRTRALPENRKAEDARAFHFAGWRLDTLRRVLLDAAGVVTPLSGAEYRLLTIFLTHPNRVLTRDQLMDLMKGRESEAFDRSIDVQVSRLRRRLREDAREPQLIKTVRAEGYVLSAEVGYDA
ncbi:MAG TPA: response regulator [Nevskiaceae bacterium]|nr:response regulator [Nevskiaceae bacterium]